MPRRKAKADATVAFNLTLPGKLARRLDAEFAKARAMNPLLFVSRSGFLAFCLAEFIAVLDDPWREPSLPKPARVRTRPAVKPAIRTGSATRKKIRAGEGVASIPA